MSNYSTENNSYHVTQKDAWLVKYSLGTKMIFCRKSTGDVSQAETLMVTNILVNCVDRNEP